MMKAPVLTRGLELPEDLRMMSKDWPKMLN